MVELPARDQLIGLDVGTTSCKAGLFDRRGRLLAQASAAYPVARPQPGWIEQAVDDYWQAAVQCLRALLAAPAADRRRLAALSSCGQTPTMVLLDEHGAPVRPAILWQDTRAAAEAEALARDPGTAVLAEWMGLRWPVDASLPLARLLWLRRHEPHALARTRITLQPKDYVHLRLTGRAATDVWSAKGLVHQGTRRPAAALCAMAGVALDLIPEALLPTAVLGRVTAAAAQETGLPEGLPVVAGWTDGMAAMLGTGAFGVPGIAADVSGTSEVVGITLPAQPATPGPLLAAPIVDTGRWVLYGPTQASGAALGWALQVLRSPASDAAAEERPPESSEMAIGSGAWLGAVAAVPAGAEGLLFLPYLEGERAPLWDPHARGALIGLRTTHSTAHVLRAVLEGVACSVRHVLAAAEAHGGGRAREVRVAGGGARLSLWNQIKADVAGRPFVPCRVTENGVLGAAILAATGVGLYPSVTAAGEAMVQLDAPVLPTAEHQTTYDRLFQRYTALYPRLRDLLA